MAKSSDIIKIGFDYRASLEQFVKETNGVFDGISEKAGKQRISIQLDAKNDKVIEKIKELQKLKLDSFTFEFGESGLAEQLKTFDQLEKKINEIINLSKGINNLGSGNGIGNSIVDEKSLNSIIDLFGKMENHLGEIKRVFTDVGDGGEFSPLLSTIDKINNSIKELSTSVEGIGLNMNIDVGSDTEMEAKVQSKISNALQAYQRLFDHIKMSGVGGSVVNTSFFEFDINQYDTMMAKLQAYRKFIENMRNEAKAQFNGKDVLFQGTNKSYWTSASAAMGQVTKAFKEMNASADTSPLENLFGGGKNLTEVVNQLNLIVDKLGEISTTASEFKNAFANSFNVSASVEEIEKLTSRVKELEDELSKVKISSTSPIKDTFQGDTKASAESSAPAIKDEAKAMEQVAESAEKASKSKDEFAKANKKVKESADSSSKAVSEEATEFNKIIGKLDGYQKKLDSFKVKPTDGHRYPIYQKNINELNEYIDKLQTLSQKDINLIKKEDVSEAQALQKEIDELIFKMSKMSASEKGFDPLGADKALEKINSELKKNSAMSKEAKRQIQGFYDEIRSGNPSKPIKDLLDDMYKLIQAERLAGREGKSFMDIFKEKVVYGAAANMAGMIGIYDIINVGRQGFETIKEYDKALTEMNKVSNESIEILKEFQQESFEVADSIGATASAIQNSTADWMKLGYSLKDSAELSEWANIYANVGDMEIDEATEHMVSSVKAWSSEFANDIEASEAIVDRYNHIGNSYAITSADIGEAMETSAAALKAGGNSLNESLGLIVSGNLIQQDASTTASALKILSLRVRGAKADLEEMGETTEGLADSSSKMREEIQALTGVDIMLDEDTFKSTAQIIKEIGAVWDSMSDVSQAATLEKIAGIIFCLKFVETHIYRTHLTALIA